MWLLQTSVLSLSKKWNSGNTCSEWTPRCLLCGCQPSLTHRSFWTRCVRRNQELKTSLQEWSRTPTTFWTFQIPRPRTALPSPTQPTSMASGWRAPAGTERTGSLLSKATQPFMTNFQSSKSSLNWWLRKSSMHSMAHFRTLRTTLLCRRRISWRKKRTI